MTDLVSSRAGRHPQVPAQMVCVALSPSIDVTYVVPALTPGTIHRPTEVYRVPGGKGFNVARAAHALGATVAPPRALGAPRPGPGGLGGGPGGWMVSVLARTGIRRGPVTGARPTRTCVSVAD